MLAEKENIERSSKVRFMIRILLECFDVGNLGGCEIVRVYRGLNLQRKNIINWGSSSHLFTVN